MRVDLESQTWTTLLLEAFLQLNTSRIIFYKNDSGVVCRVKGKTGGHSLGGFSLFGFDWGLPHCSSSNAFSEFGPHTWLKRVLPYRQLDRQLLLWNRLFPDSQGIFIESILTLTGLGGRPKQLGPIRKIFRKLALIFWLPEGLQSAFLFTST